MALVIGVVFSSLWLDAVCLGVVYEGASASIPEKNGLLRVWSSFHT